MAETDQPIMERPQAQAQLPASVTPDTTEVPTTKALGTQAEESPQLQTPPKPTDRWQYIPQEPPAPPQRADEIRGQIEANQARQDALMASLPASPNPPALRVHFDPPPKYVPLELSQTFGSLAAAFGIFASLRSRQPLINALTAGAKAMEGMQTGNTERYNTEVANWKDNMDLALKENSALVQQYNLQADKHKNDTNRIMDQWKAIAARSQDMIQMYNLERGDWDSAFKHVENINKTGLELQKHYDSLAERMLDPKRAAFLAYARKLGKSPSEMTYDEVQTFEREEKEIANGNRSRGATNERLQGNVLRASYDVLRDLDIIRYLGIKTGGGLFPEVVTHGKVTGNIARNVTQTLTTEDQKKYNAAMAGVAYEMGFVLGGGYKPSDTQIAELRNAYTVGPSDTFDTAAFKFLTLIAKLRSAMELAPSYTPEQKTHRDNLLAATKKFRSPEEYIELTRGSGPDPAGNVTLREGPEPTRRGAGGQTFPGMTKAYKTLDELNAGVVAGEFGTGSAARSRATARARELGFGE